MKKLKNSDLNRLTEKEYKECEKLPIVVVLDNIRSCNNIGSVFRTSDALLIDRIFLCGITATPPNKEIHKTALDSENTVEWTYFENTSLAVSNLLADGYQLLAVEQVENSILLPDFKPLKGNKYALIFGNEVKGVEQDIVDLCHQYIEIPQYGTKHSFNVSVSAGIVLWDIAQKLRNL
jgi:tRNA G18 (ribose-2'-O)-methylase SpoU